jgi:hypothetical protein
VSKLFFPAVIIWLLGSGVVASPDKWDEAERNVRRLLPAKFSELPPVIIKSLNAKGCTIPQTYIRSEPHNVVSGKFAAKGQDDWAILCSKGGKSSILVFWGKASPCLAELELRDDKTYLQDISGDGKIAFSRLITTVKVRAGNRRL